MLASPVSVGLLCGPDLFSPAPCWALFAVFFSARPPLSGGCPLVGSGCAGWFPVFGRVLPLVCWGGVVYGC